MDTEQLRRQPSRAFDRVVRYGHACSSIIITSATHPIPVRCIPCRTGSSTAHQPAAAARSPAGAAGRQPRSGHACPAQGLALERRHAALPLALGSTLHSAAVPIQPSLQSLPSMHPPAYSTTRPPDHLKEGPDVVVSPVQNGVDSHEGRPSGAAGAEGFLLRCVGVASAGSQWQRAQWQRAAGTPASRACQVPNIHNQRQFHGHPGMPWHPPTCVCPG